MPAVPLPLRIYDNVYDGDVIPPDSPPQDTPQDHTIGDSTQPIHLQSWDTDLLCSIVPSQQAISEDAGRLLVFEFLICGSRNGD